MSLQRDYISNPLEYIQHGSTRTREKPLKEDLEELYINQNKSVDELAEYFKYNKRMLQKVMAEYGLKKDRKQVYQVQKQTLLKTKGVENVFQLKEVKDKSKQTSLEKYGKEHFSQSEEYKIKNIQTRQERYGDDLYCREKYRQTCKEKFGVENFSQSHFTDFQKELLNNKDKVIAFIKDNNIHNASDFSEKSEIKFYATLTLLHKFDLMSMFTDYSTSSQEIELQQYLTEHNIEYIKHYRIGRKEIDIYIPSLKIGIEFNGDYWHCEVLKPNDYHKAKSEFMEQQGIFIYHIFEYEWNTKKEQILNQLNNLLGINQYKIGARKCEIREVSKIDKKEFLEINHMQGNDHSSIYLGLYYNEELVSLMTFSKPHNTNIYEWELSRFCSKANHNIIGGASKLLNWFIHHYKPKNIISYSMISHTKGTLYETLGFKCVHISKPSYVWSKNRDIKTRYQTRASYLKSKGFEGDTETEIMHNLGYARIFDCGNKVWVWNE